MNSAIRPTTRRHLLALFALPLAVQAQTMTKPDYTTAKTRISADYKGDKAACASMAGNNKDICVEQAKGKEKVARAELEYSYTAKDTDRNKVLVAKAESTYAVAKERCDDFSGDPKDICLKEAKATYEKQKADITVLEKGNTADARKDAMKTKTEADYEVAKAKCDQFSGDVKDKCVKDAKTTYKVE